MLKYNWLTAPVVVVLSPVGDGPGTLGRVGDWVLVAHHRVGGANGHFL